MIAGNVIDTIYAERYVTMGTNYYVTKNKPSIESVHIGKSSMGWLFLFREHCQWDNAFSIEWRTYKQVYKWLYENVYKSKEYVIMNEYDEIVMFNDFIDMINKKQKDKLCIQNGDNFKYCRDIDGYRFSDTDFS